MKNIINDTKLKMNLKMFLRTFFYVLILVSSLFLIHYSSNIVINDSVKLNISANLDERIHLKGTFNKPTDATVRIKDFFSKEETVKKYHKIEDFIYEKSANAKSLNIEIEVSGNKENIVVSKSENPKQTLVFKSSFKQQKNIYLIVLGILLLVFSGFKLFQEFKGVNDLSKEQKVFIKKRRTILRKYRDFIVVSENKINYKKGDVIVKVPSIEGLFEQLKDIPEQIIYQESPLNEHGTFMLFNEEKIYIYELGEL